MQFGNVEYQGFFRGMCSGAKKAMVAKGGKFALAGSSSVSITNKDVMKVTSEIASSYMKQLYYRPTSVTENEIPVEFDDILKRYNFNDVANLLQSFIALSYDMVREPDEEFNLNKIFDNETSQKILSDLLDTDSIIVGKFAQIISDNDKIMNCLSPELKNKIRNKLSNNPTTYNEDEVIDIAKKLLVREDSHNENTDIKVKKLSAGTVGEAWKVSVGKNGSENEKNYVLKLIKKGITKEKIEREKKIIVNLLGGENLPATKKYVSMLEDLTKNWIAELDLTQEVMQNKELAKGSEYFHVATAFSGTADGSAIIEDLACGMPAEKIIEIMDDYFDNYQNDSDGFKMKYANEIKKMPELKDPKKFSTRMVKNLTYALIDMMIYLKNDKNTMHGDPHGGNFFIEPNTLLPIFIDTGNCVERNYEEALNDLKFFIAYFVGDIQKMAEYYAKMCGIQDESSIKQLSDKIKEKVFYSGNNITNFADVLSALNQVAESENFVMPSEKTTALKAQAQLCNIIHKFEIISGKKSLPYVLKCIPEIIKRKNFKQEDIEEIIKDTRKHIKVNPELCFQTVFQFI